MSTTVVYFGCAHSCPSWHLYLGRGSVTSAVWPAALGGREQSRAGRWSFAVFQIKLGCVVLGCIRENICLHPKSWKDVSVPVSYAEELISRRRKSGGWEHSRQGPQLHASAAEPQNTVITMRLSWESQVTRPTSEEFWRLWARAMWLVDKCTQ